MLSSTAANLASLQRGDVIAQRYVISHALGHGAMGEVYAAIDQLEQRSVALKVVSPRAQRHRSVVQRLIRGAQAVAEIDHPHLVRVHDCGFDAAGLPFVVMELPEGETLALLLRMHEHFGIGLAIEVARQLSAAVAALHARRLVHRDLKPANVLMCGWGTAEVPELKLLDFGLTRLFDASDSISRTGELLGTLLYLAPERLAGRTTRSPEADVYAVGCVLFEMLSGRLPFVASTRAGLQLAIRSDRAPDVRELRAEVPEELSWLIARALAKSPEQRPSAEELERSLATLASSQARSIDAGAGFRRELLRDDLVAGRFRIERRIGQGAHGEVYAAVDDYWRRRVALKRLRAVSAKNLERLKREFRRVCDLEHPQLARCYELAVEPGGDALIAMELVEGASFTEHVAGSKPRLVEAVRQICAGLRALHGAGLVHRDLKPAHVLIDAGGSARLIDFSIVAAEGGDDAPAGTRRYLAPEVPRAKVSSSADMYALGLMIREAGVYDLDQPVADAFARLLAARPEERPTAAELCDLLGEAGAAVARVPSSAIEFVGRTRELERLQRAVAERAIHPIVAIVSGASGIGKSALLQQLASTLPNGTLVLQGACRAREIVPFCAVDRVLDALCQHLRAHSGHAFEELSQIGVACLIRLFPAFARVGFLRDRAERALPPSDPEEVQGLAYETLRALFCIFARFTPVLIALDDLHWLDERTSSLLGYVFRAPGEPNIVLVGTRRPSRDVSARALERLLEALGPRVVELSLGPLSAEEGAMLSRELCPESRHGQLEARLYEHSGGHPLFLALLAESAASAPLAPEIDLATLLVSRLESLPKAGRRLIDGICVCTTPLPLSLLCAALSTEPHLYQVLVELRLAQSCVIAGDLLVEPYHAAVREAVLGTLSDSARRELHRRLAETLGDRYAEAAVEHVAGAGAVDAAAKLAEQLARAAELQSDVAKAAALFGVAATHTREPSARAALLSRQADAFHRGGYTRDAATCLTEAAALLRGDAARGYERRAGELFLLCGDVRSGLRLLEAALAACEITLGRSLPEVLERTFGAYGALKTRGLEYTLRPVNELDAEPFARLDLHLLLAQGLSHVDLRGLPLAFAALALALDAGEPSRLQRACAIFVWSTASHFPTDLVEPVLGMCRDLTAAVGTSYAQALWHVAHAEQLHFRSDFLAAEFECERAEQWLLSRCTGIARELAGVRGGATFIQYSQKGDFRSRLAQTLGWMADAQRRGDLYHYNMLRAAHALVWIAQDQPEKTRAELAAAEAAWPSGVTVFEVTVALYLDVVDRYEGDKTAHLHPVQNRQSVLASPAAQTPFLKGYLELHRAWGALWALARGEVAHDEARMLQDALVSLRGLALPIWSHVAEALEANLLLLKGEPEAASRQLEQSEHGFRALHMACWAACVRRRRGEILAGQFGRRLQHEGEDQLRDLGVRRPDKWCRAYFSMFDAALINANTIT